MATLSMQAHADVLLSRADSWARGYRKRDGLEFVLFTGSKRQTYLASLNGCTCPGYAYRRECAHVLAIRLHQIEQDIEDRRADAEVNAFMAESAPAFRQQEAARRRLITSSPFFQDAPAAAKVRQIPTHGARCQTDMDAQAALDEIMRQSRRAAVLDAMGDDGQDALDAAVAARKVG